MALRQTYLSLKDKLPADSESVLVMRGRGNDELAPSKDLLDEFNRLKGRFSPDSGFATPFHFAWAKSNYAERFSAQIRQSKEAMGRLKGLSEKARTHDVFLICYEGYDKPCHRKILLEIAEKEFEAEVNYTLFLPEGAKRRTAPKKKEKALALF